MDMVEWTKVLLPLWMKDELAFSDIDYNLHFFKELFYGMRRGVANGDQGCKLPFPNT